MLYSDIKTNFATILNRRDLTASQTTLFMQFAIQRIQRVLRIPAMENVVELICDGTQWLSIPGDLLELISLNTNDNVNQDKLVKVDLQRAIRASNIPGIPTVFHRQGGSWIIGHVPPSGTIVLCNYYQDASSLVNDSDHNWLTDATPDLLLYGALVRAADFFLDERKDNFEQTFGQCLADLQEQAHQDELENASVGFAHEMSDTDYYAYTSHY